MTNMNALRPLAAGAITLALLGVGTQALGQDYTVQYPAGWACTSFDVKIEGWFGKSKFIVFKDKNGFVRSWQVGPSDEVRFTNLATGKAITTGSKGAAWHTTTYTPDGTSKVDATGHTAVVWWPTDHPPGPSIMIYTGRVSITVDALGAFTLQSTSGRAFDLCAELS